MYGSALQRVKSEMSDYTFRGVLFLGLVLLTNGLRAQIAIGEWREHFPYKQTRAVARNGAQVYCATRNAIFRLDRATGEIERYSKVNALNDVNILTIAFNRSLNALLVGYENGNVHVIREGVNDNLSDIKRSNIVGDKGIYDVDFQGGLAYLSCGFGIVVMDLV
ncbi:MAG: hypothetical protein KDB88_10935, partial [Flavobacteriales bacterium]|nr:hypothetical protein [Flavobacteriales bacterium]